MKKIKIFHKINQLKKIIKKLICKIKKIIKKQILIKDILKFYKNLREMNLKIHKLK